MDWGAISAVAEVIAAIAVVVSLIYLAVQIKDNTRHLDRTVQATRTQNSYSICEGFDRWRDMLLSPDGTDIWVRGINDLNALDSKEKMRFNTIAGSLIWSCWFMYQITRNEGLVADVNGVVWQDLFKHPGFREWLLEHRRFHADAFGEFLDSVCDAVGDERYESGESSSLTAGTY
jgi:hypothetical protein